MSTGFKYVYNSLHEQSFLSWSCEGCTLVARQQWCLKLRFAAKGSWAGGLEQSLWSGSPWFDEGQEFYSDGCLSGPRRLWLSCYQCLFSSCSIQSLKVKTERVFEELGGQWDCLVSVQSFRCPSKKSFGRYVKCSGVRHKEAGRAA